MNEQDLKKADINVLEMMINSYEKRGGGHTQKRILKECILNKKALDQAEGELPPKKKAINPRYPTMLSKEMLGFNQMHDIAKPILAKKNMEIVELQERLDNWKKLTECGNKINWKGVCIDFRKENEQLKAEVKELEILKCAYKELDCETWSKNNRLQQENQALKDKIACLEDEGD